MICIEPRRPPLLYAPAALFRPPQGTLERPFGRSKNPLKNSPPSYLVTTKALPSGRSLVLLPALLLSLSLSLSLSLGGCDSGSEARLYSQPRPEAARPHVGIAWDKPPSWRRLPESDWRLASFAVADEWAPRGLADVSLTLFSARAADEAAHVNRWRGQLALERRSAEKIAASGFDDRSPLGAFRWFELSGGPSRRALLVSITTVKDRAWIVKMTASAKAVSLLRPGFLSFSRSLKPYHKVDEERS